MVVGAFLSVAYFFFRLVSRQGLICRVIGLCLVPGGFLMSSAFSSAQRVFSAKCFRPDAVLPTGSFRPR